MTIETTTTHDLRDADSRQAFDDQVLAYATRSAVPVTSGDILAAIGGTNAQIRHACRRLIEGGRLIRKGKTRDTTYRVPGSGHLED